MKRREFITLVGGAAAWPLAVKAKEPERIRRVGMLVAFNDPDIKAFQDELEKHGWSEGRNIHIDYRVSPAAAHVQELAKELVATQPEVIFALSRPVTSALQKETHTIPIVFTYVIDPIGAGFIASLARPGGNLTGIMAYEAERRRQVGADAQGDRTTDDTRCAFGKSENCCLLRLLTARGRGRRAVARNRGGSQPHRKRRRRHRACNRRRRQHAKQRHGRAAGKHDHLQ